LRQRIENKATEIRNNVTEKITSAYDRFEARFNAAKDKTVAVAKEIGRRAAVVGLTPVAGAEAVFVEIYQIPAGIREGIADWKEKKADALRDKIAKLEQQSASHREKAGARRDKAANMNSVRGALDRVRTTG
jgi:uncharacterized protein YhaN